MSKTVTLTDEEQALAIEVLKDWLARHHKAMIARRKANPGHTKAPWKQNKVQALMVKVMSEPRPTQRPLPKVTIYQRPSWAEDLKALVNTH